MIENEKHEYSVKTNRNIYILKKALLQTNK